MSNVDVVPAASNRTGFAAWAISQDPPLRTSSHEAFGVPLDLLPDVPEELLDGALIDGTRYRPVREGFEPDGKGYRPVDVPVDDGAQPEPLTAPAKKTTTGRTSSRRKSTPKEA